MELLAELLRPVYQRVGTLVGSTLAGAGVAHDDVSVIAAGAVALAGVAVDLAFIYLKKRLS